MSTATARPNESARPGTAGLRRIGRHQPENLPPRPPRSRFAVSCIIGVVAMTAITAWDWRWGVGFSPLDVFERLTRPNPVLRGLGNPDFGQLVSDRTRARFLETLRMAVLGTVGGGLIALPLALWSTRIGNPIMPLRSLARTVNNVIRAIPDVVWALLFGVAVGRNVLAGTLALFFFSIAVIAKLTSDTLDGIDVKPVEAANASGARHTQMLRSSVVPQILPAYSSFVLYSFELNLRASAVLGFVGAGGIGQRLNQFRDAGNWEAVWGIVIFFFIIVFVVERISTNIRRRLL